MRIGTLSLAQVMVMAQGKTMMVDVPEGTAMAQFEVLVAKRTGLPLGSFGLYHEGRPLRSLSRGTIELKTRGRGGGDYGSDAGEASAEQVAPSILGRTDSPVTLGTASTNDPRQPHTPVPAGGHVPFFDRCCTCFTGANTGDNGGGTSNSGGGSRGTDGDDADTPLPSEALTAPPIEMVTLEQQVYDPCVEGELVTTEVRPGNLPHEIYTALTKFDDGLVEAFRAGDIRLVRSEWFLALPDGYRIQRRQDLEALAPASPLLMPEEAVALLRQGNRGVGSLTYGCALRDSILRGIPRSA